MIKERIDAVANNKNLTINTPITTAKIELTGVCTLQCNFCFNSAMRNNNLRQRYMTDEDFNRVLTYLKLYPDLKEVGLFYMGESGLHPKLAEYYKRLKELGYFTYLTTNATYIDNIIKAIPYIDSLKVSWNYSSKSDFVKKTGCHSNIYENIKKNIGILYGECQKYNKPLAISTVLDTDKKEYEPTIKNLPCTEHYYIPLQTQGGTIKEGLGGVVGQSENMSTKIPCWSLFKGLYIDCDLNVRTCCYGHSKEHILGNIKDEVSYNKKDLKEMHLRGITPSICQKCLE